jgi:phosphatidylglycerophosphate synthase
MWQTKPTDRFLLRFVKVHLSAPISSRLVRRFPGIRPLPITFTASFLGISAGVALGFGAAFAGGLLTVFAQVLDGVDGQIARLTGRESAEGAFLDSVLDRYMDFSLVFGMLFYCLRFSSGRIAGDFGLGPVWLLVLAAFAAAGSSQVSYTVARAASLSLPYRRSEFAGKGTRTMVTAACGLLTPLWPHFPLFALVYLALHPNLAVLFSLLRRQAAG